MTFYEMPDGRFRSETGTLYTREQVMTLRRSFGYFPIVWRSSRQY